VSDYDLTNYISLSGTWEAPFAKLWSRGPQRLTRGWTLQPIFNHRSGEPIDVTAGLSRSRTAPGPSAVGDQTLVRANLVAPMTFFDPRVVQTFNGRKGNYFFDPTAISRADFVAASFDPVNNPSQRSYGTLGRNSFRGPARTNIDISIAKITNID